jgi:hypothetical protein
MSECRRGRCARPYTQPRGGPRSTAQAQVSDQQAVTKGQARKVKWPAADSDWHPLARDIYLGCKSSGQADFYQQSDIAMLRSLMDDLSVAKRNPGQHSGQLLQTLCSTLSNLLVTEGDRRRVRIELNEPEQEAAPASVSVLADYREQLGVSQ